VVCDLEPRPGPVLRGRSDREPSSETDQQDPVEQRFSSSHGLGRGAMGRRRSLVKEDP